VSFILFFVLAGTLGLASRPWFPPLGSLHGRGIQRMLDFTLAATGAFFVLGHLVLAYIIARAARETSRTPPPARARTEWLVGLIPAAVMALVAEGGVLVLGLPVWAQYYGPAPAEAFKVEVTGRQFFWVVRYPGRDGVFGRTSPSLVSGENPPGLDRTDPAAADDVVLLNDLYLPAARPARVTLRSTDVIHSFFVPELRVKQDAVPGMAIPLGFTPTRAAEYEIACNQICGLGHYRMRGLLHVLEGEAFLKWMDEQPPFFDAI
jgi:cytochrome c oxidase subunit 2